MKKIVTLVLGLCLLGTVSPLVSQAAEKGEKRKLTDDQKKIMKEINEKYDTNKDGKLDKEERAKVSADDKKKMKDAGLSRGKKEGDEKKAE